MELEENEEPHKKRRRISDPTQAANSGLLTLPSQLLNRILLLLPLHERYMIREVCNTARDIAAAHLQSIQKIDLSPYPGIFGEDLEALLPICTSAAFLDISNCRYISYEYASKVASAYPSLVMKVDQSFFQNKQVLKRDTHFTRALYKLAWSDEVFNVRTMAQFSSLVKLELSNCETNFTFANNGATPSLPQLKFLKVTQVTFTKANSLLVMLKATTKLEVLVIRDCSGITETDLEPITDNKQLQKLVLRGCSMKQSTWNNLPLATLRKIGVDVLPNFEDSEEAVAKALATAPLLKSIILGVALTNDDFVEALALCRSTFTTITKLFLGDSVDDRGCVITEDGLTQCGQLFPNCSKLLFSGVENLTAFGAFTRVEELQLFGGSYDPAELQQLLSSNNIEKLTLEHVEPDDEGEQPLIIKSQALESFTTSSVDFGITSMEQCDDLDLCYILLWKSALIYALYRCPTKVSSLLLRHQD